MPDDPRKTAHRVLAEHGQRRPEPRLPSIDDLADLARGYLQYADSVAAERETLVDGEALYVTITAARAYAAGVEALGLCSLAVEDARRELTELLIDARQSSSDPSSWRVRSRSSGLDVSVRVAIEGRLLVVVGASVRDYNTGGGRRRG